jgi:hypothetical protein
VETIIVLITKDSMRLNVIDVTCLLFLLAHSFFQDERKTPMLQPEMEHQLENPQPVTQLTKLLTWLN